jgi:transcriptional regulator with XRE-family HTH domain
VRVESFGRHLRAWREKQQPRLTQEALARRLECSLSEVSKWERGLVLPGRHLVRLADEIGPAVFSWYDQAVKEGRPAA